MNPIEREASFDRVAQHAGSMGMDAAWGDDSTAIIRADAELYRMMLADDPQSQWDGETMGFSARYARDDLDSARWNNNMIIRDEAAGSFLRTRKYRREG